MGKQEKFLQKVLSGQSDVNLDFFDLCSLLKSIGFDERIRGDHHIFTRPNVKDILNLQPKQSKAKPYQVKQIRNLILRYNLKIGG